MLEERRAQIRATFGLAADAAELPERLRGGWIEDDWNGDYVEFRHHPKCACDACRAKRAQHPAWVVPVGQADATIGARALDLSKSFPGMVAGLNGDG